jgi:hypothetical protein
MKVAAFLFLAAIVCIGFAGIGCETSHTETDKTGWFGEHTHKETTVRENPITGDTSVEHKEQTTR